MRDGLQSYITTVSLNTPDVFHASQLQKYIPDSSLAIQFDDVQVRENLTFEASPLRIEDRKVKHLRCKKIASVKVMWGGPVCGSVMWELESRIRESYPELFPSGNFRGREFFKWGRVVIPQIQLKYLIKFSQILFTYLSDLECF